MGSSCACDRQNTRTDIDADYLTCPADLIRQLQQCFACAAANIENSFTSRGRKGVHSGQTQRRHLQIDQVNQFGARLVAQILKV